MSNIDEPKTDKPITDETKKDIETRLKDLETELKGIDIDIGRNTMLTHMLFSITAKLFDAIPHKFQRDVLQGLWDYQGSLEKTSEEELKKFIDYVVNNYNIVPPSNKENKPDDDPNKLSIN